MTWFNRLNLNFRILCIFIASAIASASLILLVIKLFDTQGTRSVTGVLEISFLTILLNVVFAAFYLKKTIGKLDQLASILAESLSQLYFEAQKLLRVADDLSSTTSEQAASIQQTVAAVDEIGSTVSLNAQHTASSRELAQKSRDAALEGKSVVAEITQSMTDINLSTGEILKNTQTNQQEMTSIIELIKEIETKTKVINDIAFQTKLLSFNASVEAARAGEHGKGFSVVAEEIGNLAQMSGSAATEISKLLGGSTLRVKSIIEQSVRSGESLLKRNQEKIDRGVATANQCGQVLDLIVGDITDLAQRVAEIATATKEQSNGLSEIGKAMVSLNENSGKNTISARETSHSGEQLAKQAADVSQLVDDFVVTVRGKTNPRRGATELMARMQSLGRARLGETTEVGELEVPDLVFGTTGLANNFEIPDELKKEFGGVATVFVKHKGEFIRISTNLLKKDGARAIGTPLLRNAAFEAVDRGQAFTGNLDVLGTLFETHYMPILDGSEVIGACYFGNKLK